MKKFFTSFFYFILFLLSLTILARAERPMESVAAGVTLTATNVTSTITALAGSNLPCSRSIITNPDPTYVVFITQAANTYTAYTQYWYPIPPNQTVDFNQVNDGTKYWYSKVSPTPLTIATGYKATKPSRINPWY